LLGFYGKKRGKGEKRKGEEVVESEMNSFLFVFFAESWNGKVL